MIGVVLILFRFRCDKCEFATALKRNLERHHIRVHSHIKPFSCPMQGCGYQVRFTKSFDFQNLIQHF